MTGIGTLAADLEQQYSMCFPHGRGVPQTHLLYNKSGKYNCFNSTYFSSFPPYFVHNRCWDYFQRKSPVTVFYFYICPEIEQCMITEE